MHPHPSPTQHHTYSCHTHSNDQHQPATLVHVQVYTTESSFLIHHANAYEEGDETVVWSSGWGPEALSKLEHGAGMLGSWRAVLRGDFSGIPFTSMLQHRYGLCA